MFVIKKYSTVCIKHLSSYGSGRLHNLNIRSMSSSFGSVHNVRTPKISVKMYENGKRPNFTVCVEGNIGSGKTTLLKYFSKFQDVEVFQEPVDKWRNVKGVNLLDLMYKDPNRWSLLFQSYVQLTMMELHLKPSPANVKLIERSIYSARYCFVENLHRSGKMSEAEYNVYCEWFKMITKTMDTKVDLIVYLRTNPNTVYDRIKSRSRSEEQLIPLEYLESLHDLHEEWLICNTSQIGAPVLILEADDDVSVMYQKFEQKANEILCRSDLSSTNEKEIPASPKRTAAVN